MDGERDGAEEAEALLKIPDARVRKRVPLQRLRLQTKEMGTRTQS